MCQVVTTLFYLCTDYVCGGEMFTHLHQVGPFSERHARVYIAEITLALEHLHKVTLSLSLCLTHAHS